MKPNIVLQFLGNDLTCGEVIRPICVGEPLIHHLSLGSFEWEHTTLTRGWSSMNGRKQAGILFELLRSILPGLRFSWRWWEQNWLFRVVPWSNLPRPVAAQRAASCQHSPASCGKYETFPSAWSGIGEGPYAFVWCQRNSCRLGFLECCARCF